MEGIDGTFVLAMAGLIGSGILSFYAYVLRSRCEEVRCCGLFCKRSVINGERVADSLDRERGARATNA